MVSLDTTHSKWYDFDDVVLLPDISDIDSRFEVSLPNRLVISSPMRGISSPTLVEEMWKLGGFGILHRFFQTEGERMDAICALALSGCQYGIAIGLDDIENKISLIKDMKDLNGLKLFCVDVANGYMMRLWRAIRKLKEAIGDDETPIMAGNVATGIGALRLAEAGVDYIRVGIGGGSACSTRNVTGIGVPSLTAISECAKVLENFPCVSLVADGGIRGSGEAVKALAFGANNVMVGGLLARACEAGNDGEYEGMASYKHQEAMGMYKKSGEGLVLRVPENEIRPLKEIMDEFLWGIKSGLSYLGVKSIYRMHSQQIKFVEVGRNTIKNI